MTPKSVGPLNWWFGRCRRGLQGGGTAGVRIAGFVDCGGAIGENRHPRTRAKSGVLAWFFGFEVLVLAPASSPSR